MKTYLRGVPASDLARGRVLLAVLRVGAALRPAADVRAEALGFAAAVVLAGALLARRRDLPAEADLAPAFLAASREAAALLLGGGGGGRGGVFFVNGPPAAAPPGRCDLSPSRNSL